MFLNDYLITLTINKHSTILKDIQHIPTIISNPNLSCSVSFRDWKIRNAFRGQDIFIIYRQNNKDTFGSYSTIPLNQNISPLIIEAFYHPNKQLSIITKELGYYKEDLE